jgi:hypothetical protein
MPDSSQYDILALLSGGLDSILASRLMQQLGKRVLCLHFVTPFFGKPHLVNKWKEVYGLDVLPVDVSEEFIAMLARGPEHGFGKVLNPCIDCKILLLRKAKSLMPRYGATTLITGEVLGQRPMSQRKDALNIIRNEAGVGDILLRPLCAKLLPEIPAEKSGFIDRSRLKAFFGRGRKAQLSLAAEYGITDIPTPAGGCLLTEPETAKAYWPVLRLQAGPLPDDFRLAKAGRQFWRPAPAPRWLIVGRTQADNEKLCALASETDLLFSLENFTGPTALGRNAVTVWPEALVRSAAAHMAAFSGKASAYARETGHPVRVLARRAGAENGESMLVTPEKDAAGWGEISWPQVKEEIRAQARKMAERGKQGGEYDCPDKIEPA